MALWHADFDLGGWHVSPKLNRISTDSESINIKHKSMAVLVFLADAGGELLTRDEILNAVWPGMEVTDDVLTQSVVELRKAFGDDAKNPRIIETIPRVGFRLIAAVVHAEEAPAQTAVQTVIRQTFRQYILFGLVIVAVALTAWVITERRDGGRNSVIVVQESPSIAVLPFVNMSDDPGNQYFADGISEEIRSLLARIPSLKVFGRTSSIKFKEMEEDLRVIGQTYGVKTVLEGSVRMSGDRVRITAQLVDVYDGSFIWFETYDRTMTGIFEVQDDVAAAIIDALQIYVSAFFNDTATTENPEAYSLFLRARAAANAFDMQDAEVLLEQTVELDPNFAEAWEMLAFVYWINPEGTGVLESQRRLRETAAQAIALDPDLVLAQTYYEVAESGPGIRLRTIEAFERAARKRPDDPSILEAFTFLLTEFGYLQEAVAVAERLHQLDPLSEASNYHLPLALYAVGRTEDAIAALEYANQSDFAPQLYRWAIEGVNLVESQDETAIAHVEAYLQQQDYPDSSWFRELVTGGRDPATGQAYLDGRIPQIVAAMAEVDEIEWHRALTNLYLYFGYLDRYFELVLATEPVDTTWHPAGAHLWQSAIFRRLGSTEHAKYIEFVESMGVIDIWEQRGPPDFCDKVDGEWVCE
jgi:TolB-like protein/DNA-binding winged helix-turn-helix (wHTH) protein